MGGMVDCGVALDSKTSPRRAAIEKAQEELRLEYDVREERRRELEFLEKGGNPLDFKFSNVASLSVQSTSLNVTSEAKGSFALAPSPHGDSVESSGPNMADNLLLLDGDNSNPGSGLEKSSNINNRNGNGNNIREQEEPGILRFARRNRSRPSNNAVRPATLPSKENAKPCTKETSKSLQPEEGKEREKGEPMLVSPVSNSKPGSPMKCEPTVVTTQAEEMSIEGEVKPMQMDVDARAEETETQNIEKLGEKAEALTGSVKNEKEETEVDVAVSNDTNTRCNDELTAPSTLSNDEITDRKGVPPSDSTPENGLTENEASGIATETHAEELDSKVAEMDPSNLVTVQIMKDEKEEEVRLEKPSDNETTAEAKSKEDSSVVEPALDEAAAIPPPPVSEVAEAAPSVEVAKEVVEKENEDEILEKARIIEGNLKRAEGMPLSRLSLEKRRKSHWDFVLEEMAWLANDFMQERLWKTAAASQLSRWITCGGREKFEEANLQRRQRNMAKTVAKVVMGFWHMVDAERKQGKSCMKDDSNSRQSLSSVKSYAFRVLDFTSDTLKGLVPAEAPTTPDRPSDKGVLLVLEQLPEESLFYTVPPGALQAYRESIEAQFAQLKKTGIAANHDDCETSNSVADIPRENAYEEDEVQNGICGYEGGFSPKFSKKRKHPDSSHQKAYASRLHETGPQAMLQEPYAETKPPTRTQVLPNGKRPLHSPNIVIIPAKKVRTQVPGRKPGPHMGATAVPTGTKMDASSDTNSYQEERTSLQHCDSFSRRTVEVESPVSRGPSHDDIVVAKSKKKKTKHPEQVFSGPGKNSMFEHRSHGDAGRLHDQKDHLKNRIESHQIDNGNNGMYGQHGPRKPKISPSQQEGVGLTGAAISTGPSHNGSSSKQMIKIVNSGRDRGGPIRKGKGAKLAATHTGPGSTWSSFEDQNLVVLVHDLGPNWELISDVINSTLPFKCKHRRAKECKERHQSLMETSTLDGADSADDSGSSQPYTQLRGIPKGTARHLFQKLQGPMEEDTIKSNFEKIISLSHKFRPRKSQEGKQVPPAHNSHVVALSQVCPNNLSGTILTPLDLSDAPSPSTEMPQVGYGGGHTNGLLSQGQQGSMGAPVLPPTSNMGSVMQGSPGMVLGGSLPSPSNQLNAPSREQQRIGMPRGPMLQPDEQQQRMQQQYNHMVSGRSIPQPGLPLSGPLPPSGVDRGGGVRILPPGGGSNGMNSMMPSGSGLTRAMPPVTRPGFQRLNSPGMLNMVPPSGNMHSASGPGMQGPMNPMLRPRDSMQLLRPGQNMDEHSRQMMMQEMQLQQMPSQGNNNGGAQFAPGPPSSISSNTTTSPPVQSFPTMQTHGPQAPHPQMFSNHPTPQQQAYAIHFAKERQMQQKQQQQRMMPSAQQSPIMASPSPPGPGSGSNLQAQQQQKNLSEGPGAGSAAGPGTKKQKQNTQPRQSNQSGKGSKGRGGGSILMHQNLAGPGSTVLNTSLSPQSSGQSNKLYPSPTHIVPLGGASRLGQPQVVDPSQLSQMPSDSGNSNQQENMNGNDMLIGPGPVSSSGHNQGTVAGQRPSGLGGAHWQPKSQVQNTSNNSNRSVVQSNVYGQPSNSGPG